MSSVNRDFFQLFVLPSDAKSAITFEWIELVENKLHSLNVRSNGFHTIYSRTQFNQVKVIGHS